MNLLLSSFFCLQILLGNQVAAAQVPAQKPKKTLTVTVTPQSSLNNGTKKKTEWIQAFSMSFIDEQNDKKQMVLMVPTNFIMVQENYLGVFTTPVSPAMTSQFSRILAPKEGLLVNYVHAQSPAAFAGCKLYDILVSIDETKLKSSRQLRELVIGHTADNRVKLKLIRTAKLQTIEVKLTKRKNLANFIVLETKQRVAVGTLDRMNRTVDAKINLSRGLFYAPVDYRLNGRRMSHGYWTFIKPNANNLKTSVLPSTTATRSISVETRDGNHFVVGWNTGSQSHTFQGTLSEIRKKCSTLPKEFQVMVERNLKVAKVSLKTKNNRSIKVNFKPHLVGKNYALRFNLVHPSVKNGEKAFRCFEIDHVYALEKPVRMTELLTLKLLNSELERMKPSYRNAVVATLKKLQPPKVKVEIENSQ